VVNLKVERRERPDNQHDVEVRRGEESLKKG
jgi:hypothetical protein